MKKGVSCCSFMAETAAEQPLETHVLAVDDCVVDRLLIQRLLRSETVTVTTADSAQAALKILGIDDDENAPCAIENRLNFSLIITDYCMPGMTGYDFLKKLKETQVLKEIPVVIMSSENVTERIQRCMERGAKDFILKPLQMKDVQRLRGYVRGSSSSSSSSSSKPCVTKPVCGKRKVSSMVVIGAEESERRPRIGGVTVA